MSDPWLYLPAIGTIEDWTASGDVAFDGQQVTVEINGVNHLRLGDGVTPVHLLPNYAEKGDDGPQGIPGVDGADGVMSEAEVIALIAQHGTGGGYSETVLASKDFAATPEAGFSLDTIGSHDEIYGVGWGLNSPNALRVLLRNSGADITGTAAYRRVGRGGSGFNQDVTDGGYLLTSATSVGYFEFWVRNHTASDRPTVVKSEMGFAGSVKQQSEQLYAQSIVTHEGITLDAGGPMTAGKAVIVGRNF